ncbi:MAG: cytochrome c oxidase accessory protein CcoG [Thioalkalispiraceae bacterium]|jgi:cytochrome c oxidase accessory protein FixG
MSEQTAYVDERIPVYPRSVKGKFRNIKTIILLLAYGVYFILPWLPWTRETGPSQTVLFDIVNRRFYIFDLVVYAQDIFWLAGFLIIGAFLLFFVTGILGRVFCGYFCFQTLWTDVFIFIERLVQGERNARIKLAKSGWNGRKLRLLAITWLLWLVVSFWTGLSFTLYWGEAEQLVMEFFTGQAPFPAYATTLFLTITTVVMAGLAREQVCTYMCPYARFQSAMFDKDTLLVAYDEKRGESNCGRCKPSKENLSHDYREQQGIGDCIDCGYCVQVCPVGIDIRNGLQYQCISCALCIDACDTMMDTINYPRGLIKYTSQNQLENKKHRFFKFKTVGYALALLIAITVLISAILNRQDTELHVRQVRQPLYITLSDGFIQNRYSIKVFNKQAQLQEYVLITSGIEHARIEVKPSSRFSVEGGNSLTLNARVSVDPQLIGDVQEEFQFVLINRNSQEKIQVRAQIFLPN